MADIRKVSEWIVESLSDDLLTPKYRKHPDRTRTEGHCYAAAEALYHLFGGKPCWLTPMVASFEENGEKMTHWWIRRGNEIFDPTAEQFTIKGDRPPYEKGAGAGFLTKEPSKRARAIIGRVLEAHAEEMTGIPAADKFVLPFLTEKEADALRLLSGKTCRRMITDMGESAILTDGAGGTQEIGRYGVWEERRGKSECIDCGNDLAALAKKWHLPETEVVRLPKARKTP